MRILVVEDSKRLRESLGTGLRRSGYAADLTGDGTEGLWLAQTNPYDVIVLDLMLPGMDGLAILTKLREEGCTAPVIILTARDAVEDRVLGLNTGADDYMIKPFALDELLARIQTLVRRGYGTRNPRLKICGLEIDTAARRVLRDGAEIVLTPREYALIELLALKRGEVISRTEIEQRLYDERVEPASNVVDAAVCALRRKVDPPGGPSIIQTRRGMGYCIEDGPG